MAESKPYRLALDIGTNSIGWACLSLVEDSVDKDTGELRFSPGGLLDGGVVLFSDGRDAKTYNTLNQSRRMYRGRRVILRRRQRRLRRLRGLLRQWLGVEDAAVDTFLQANKGEDVYGLRFQAAQKKLSDPAALAAVLLHMAKHRYFQSNSLVEDEEDAAPTPAAATNTPEEAEKSGKPAKDTRPSWRQDEDNIRAQMQACFARHRDSQGKPCAETLGGYLHLLREEQRRLPGEQRRGAGIRRMGTSTPDERPPAATRRLIGEELECIRTLQGDVLSTERWDAIGGLILEQLPLRPQDPGPCSVLPGQKRASEALPSSVLWRIRQTVNNLRLDAPDGSVEENTLDEEQRENMVRILCRCADAANPALRKEVGLRGRKFTVEKKPGPGQRKQKGDPVGAKLAEFFGEEWHELPLPERDKIVAKLLDWRRGLVQEDGEESSGKPRTRAVDNAKVIDRLSKNLVAEHGLDEDVARDMARFVMYGLPTDYVSVCKEVIEQTLPFLEKGEDFETALRNAGLRRPSVWDEKTARCLPYYGVILQNRVAHPGRGVETKGERPLSNADQHGRVANISVHTALNQLRKLVNAVIDKYGRPGQVVVEMNRELAKGAQERNEIRSSQDASQKNNDGIKEEIRAALAIGEERPACGWGKAIRMYRLWKEQNELDIYHCPKDSAQKEKKIGLAELLSTAYDIDHIVPRSRGGIEKPYNEVVSSRMLNQKKGDRTPWEWLERDGEGDWQVFQHRMKSLSKSLYKKMKYIQNWERDIKKDPDGNAIWRPGSDRDASYITKMALEYLQPICSDIWATNGHMTASFSRELGFRRYKGEHRLYKNRADQRHHFLDAVIIGLIDRKRIKFWNTMHAKDYKMVGREDVFRKSVQDNWPRYYEDVRDGYAAIVPAKRQKKHIPVGRRGTAQGQLHEETHYSLWQEQPDGSWRKESVSQRETSSTDDSVDCIQRLASRSTIHTLFLDDKKAEQSLQNMVGSRLAEKLRVRGEELKNAETKFHKALQQACQERGIKKLQVFSSADAAKSILIGRGRGKSPAVVLSGNNDCLVIRENAKGQWEGTLRTNMESAEIARQRVAQSTQQKNDSAQIASNQDEKNVIFELRQEDYLLMDVDGVQRLFYVKSFTVPAVSKLWPVHLTPVDSKSYKKLQDFYKAWKASSRDGWVCSPEMLRKCNARLCRVNILGELKVYKGGTADPAPVPLGHAP